MATQVYEIVLDYMGGCLQPGKRTLRASMDSYARLMKEYDDIEHTIMLKVVDNVVTEAWEYDYQLDVWIPSLDYDYHVGETIQKVATNYQLTGAARLAI